MASGRRQRGGWLDKVNRIPLCKRIYQDEAPIYANEAPKKGRARKGKPIFRARKRYAKKYTLHLCAKRDGVLHWDLSSKNADTKEVERVAVDAAGEMESGDTLIWDRLDRSGACTASECATLQPRGEATFEERGNQVPTS